MRPSISTSLTIHHHFDVPVAQGLDGKKRQQQSMHSTAQIIYLYKLYTFTAPHQAEWQRMTRDEEVKSAVDVPYIFLSGEFPTFRTAHSSSLQRLFWASARTERSSQYVSFNPLMNCSSQNMMYISALVYECILQNSFVFHSTISHSHQNVD